MESELDLLLGTAIDSLIKLEILLYFRARPGVVRRPQEVSSELRRSVSEVQGELDQLAEAGLVDRFSIGTGRHVMYGPAEDEHVHRLIGILYDRYHRDPESRSQLVRSAVGHRDNPPPPSST
ncbi:MAG: hypothetical protein JXA57_02975 [Armatimonadetes bacterium]|nr:hypothetical protein [Armatimonadota bacterium]